MGEKLSFYHFTNGSPISRRCDRPPDVRDPSLTRRRPAAPSQPPLRDGATGGDHVPHDPPAYNPPRAEAEHLRGEAGAERLAPARQHLGLAADLDPAHPPRIHRGQVVHEELALEVFDLLVREHAHVAPSPARPATRRSAAAFARS